MASRSLPPYQRRRSHSAHDQTSPIRDTSGRISSQITKKRAHASACNASPSSYSLESPTKWDVDRWRKGKRARRDSVDHHHHHHTTSAPRLSLSSSSSSSQGPPSTPVFPCTAADFDLFSSQKRRHMTVDDAMDTESVFDDKDVSKIRSNAFWELRRSVEESGEGLVQRMREYEDEQRARLQHSAWTMRDRGRSREYHGQNKIASPSTDEKIDDNEDEDNIQIFSGFTADLPISSPFLEGGHSHLVTASANDGIDLCFELEGSDGATCDSEQSAYATDDDEFMNVTYTDIHSQQSSSPLLTGTGCSSSPAMDPVFQFSNTFIPTLSLSNSSPHTRNTSSISSPSHLHPFTFTSPLSLSTTASRNERAIAALTLAMANGAGGLNDYTAARVFGPNLEEEQNVDVGELWH